jgi:asparagine synthetase B (glutamine-hydrolysing)
VLLLAADPYGTRKLFVVEESGGLRFCSSLAGLAASFPDGVALDRSLEDFLLGFEFLPWERSPAAGVKYLRSGTLMRVAADGITRSPIKPSEFPEAKAAASLESEDALTDALDDLLRTSILDQAPAGRKIAVLLGGVDSALIAAYLVKSGRDVETFTFQFADARYNQAHCEDLARLLGICHNWVPITPDVIRDGLARYSAVFNQVSAIPHYVIQTAHVCRAIRARGITHCLTGDGCDEIFLGYPSVYRRARLFMRAPALPRIVTRMTEAGLASPIIEDSAGHLARFTRNYAHILSRPWPARGHISNRIFDEYSLRRLRRDPAPVQDADAEQILGTLAHGLERLSPLRLAYHGKSSVGLNKIKLEGSANAAGVAIVSPYQHPRMTAFGASLPETLLRRSGDADTAVTGKYILFRMIERKGYLPHHIIYQRKASPVNAPVDYWYIRELRPFMLEKLRDLPFAYDAAYVERMLTLKRTEEWFRSNISLARSILHPVAMLATYADLHRSLRRAVSGSQGSAGAGPLEAGVMTDSGPA